MVVSAVLVTGVDFCRYRFVELPHALFGGLAGGPFLSLDRFRCCLDMSFVVCHSCCFIAISCCDYSD